jgi:hypothetical protein
MHLMGRSGARVSTEMSSRTSSCSIWPSLNSKCVLAVSYVSFSDSNSYR